MGNEIKPDESVFFRLPVISINCKNCKFWKPTYFQHGQCTREYSPHSKVHSEGPDNFRIVTHATFHCSEFEQAPPDTKDTL